MTAISATMPAQSRAATPVSSVPIGLTIAGAAVGGIIGGRVAHALGGGVGRYALIGGGLAVAGGIAGALLGARGIGSGGSGDGREVGVAYGRTMVDNADGTSTWAETRETLHLGRASGARDGYATLVEAVAATKPNTSGTELAYVRTGAIVSAYELQARGLDAIIAFEATDPSVIAYTTRLSGQLHAGPGATDTERAQSQLAPPPPPPF